MYGPGPGGGRASGPIGVVEISVISGKAGHRVRSELSRLLAAGDPQGPAQRLDVRLNEQVIPLGIRLDESASRAELRLTADYVLTRPEGQPLRGSLLSVVNYDVPLAAFAAIAAQDDARERAAEVMAHRLRAELAIRLRQAQDDS
jgi:LPS-assembly lipoprotein